MKSGKMAFMLRKNLLSLLSSLFKLEFLQTRSGTSGLDVNRCFNLMMLDFVLQ